MPLTEGNLISTLGRVMHMNDSLAGRLAHAPPEAGKLCNQGVLIAPQDIRSPEGTFGQAKKHMERLSWRSRIRL